MCNIILINGPSNIGVTHLWCIRIVLKGMLIFSFRVSDNVAWDVPNSCILHFSKFYYSDQLIDNVN